MAYDAFSPLAGGTLADMYDPFAYQFKFYGENYTRRGGPNGPFPYPSEIGHINGVVPLMDALEFGTMLGPVVNGPDLFLMQSQRALRIAFPGITGGLSKTTG